jgi:cytochrome c5
MSRNRIQALAAVAVILVGTIVLACAAPASPDTAEPTAAPSSSEGETLVQERCTECHDLARVESASKDRAGWEENVTRMVAKGAELNEEEQAIVVDYLTEAYGP